MSTFGILGMIFGMSALGLVMGLRKEFDELKKNLEDTGVLKRQIETEKD